jgi:hypothetical protein
MKRFATVVGCVTALALAAAPISLAADVPADVQVDSTTDVYTGETASAAQTIESVLSCTKPALSTLLTGLGDRRSYFPAPGADFESSSALAGWQLTGGAARVAGNEPSRVLGAAHATSLRLPPGSSATSPVFCIDLDYPTFRFFVEQVQAKADAGLQIDVVYPDVATKNVRRAATVKGGPTTAWTLAKDVPLQPNTAGKQAGWRRVALRFSVPLGKMGADWRVDDVLVDPRCRF